MSELTEEYLPIPGYEGFYEVSDWGNIRSVARKVKCRTWMRTVSPMVLARSFDGDGYPMVSISTGGSKQTLVKVHRIVMLAFVGPLPEGMQTRHLNDIKDDCRLINLCYGTGMQNWADRKANGNGIDGQNHPNCKLSLKEIEEIKSLKGKETYAEIGRLFHISATHASYIIKGKSHVQVK